MDTPDKYLTGVAVRKRFGIAASSLQRWLHDETMGFPKPVVIRKKWYFKESDLIAWEDKRRLDFSASGDTAPGN
jgi:predicted DNA-binding transcriptional regulator AlpA